MQSALSRTAHRLSVFIAVVTLALCATAESARAVPSFAAQTGQPCTACHIGGFGPQLTPLGRAFKIGGYTQAGGQGWLSQIPPAAMVIGSFTYTDASQPEPAAPHLTRNNNPALDQASLFLAGRLTDYAGGFMQGTYDGVNHSFALDNVDLRLTAPIELKDTELRIGLSVNNGPTV